MIQSKIAVVVVFLTLTVLAGCGKDEPSNSNMENQVASELPSCPELSITNFQKLNGYLQTDGSYIDQVQYDITYTPTDAISEAINQYYPQLVELDKEKNDDSYQATELLHSWNQAPADQQNQKMKALNQDLYSAVAKFNKLQTEMNIELSTAIGPNCSASDLIGVFSNSGSINVLAKPQNITLTQTLHFIKSDNGWVIQ